MYERGIGVPRDDAEALAWCRLAADQGEVFALTNLGSRYFHGVGVVRDPVEASRLWRLAADKGHANPQQAALNRELAQAEAEKLRPVLTELKHLSSRQIAVELTLRGVATSRGGKWQSPTVLRMIHRLELR
ncbi:SEL1-like repeat protein [Bradyrhizobium sp. AUGA SZCCT0182]|nr:SEL1-like repeat protein [Bradyrhizobium sp. AUGA SZCCT0182]